MSKLGQKKLEKKTQLVRLGQREIEILGLSQGFWSDLYHRSMAVSWPAFFGSAAALFIALNAMCFLAVMTGLTLPVSRGRVITRHEGRQTLIIHMANARHTAISRANARLWIIRVERTKEGEELRRFYELKLDRSDHPVFALSWNLFQVIDKDSPIHGLTESDLAEADALLVLNVGGIDDSSTQQLHARRVYSWRDIRSHHRYKDITSVSPQVACCSTTLNSTTRCQSSRGCKCRHPG